MFAMKVGHAWSGIFCSVASLKSYTWSQSNIGIWQYQNTNDLFQVNAKKLVFPLGLLMRLSVEFGNLNTALGRKKTKEIYQWK